MKPEFDVLSGFTLLAGFLVGQQAGPVLAPYLLILLMSTAGALSALGRREADKKPSGLTFIFVVNCIAVGFTSLLASQVAARVEYVEAPALFAPVALVLGMIGLDYPVLIPYLYNKYLAWRRGGNQQGDQNG